MKYGTALPLALVAALTVQRASSLTAQSRVARAPRQAPATRVAPSSEQQSAFDAAVVYERLGEFQKAEEQFLIAMKASDPNLARLALAGLTRTAQKAQQAQGLRSLLVAEEYERQEQWSLARDTYGDVARTATGSQADRALQGLKRIHDHSRSERRAAAFDASALWFSRVAGVAFVGWWIWRLARSLWTARRSIKVLPFVGQNDEASEDIVFWLAYVRASLRRVGSTPGAVLMVSHNLPLVELPGLPSDVAEVDDLQIGETKLPLKHLFDAWGRARVRISGGWSPSAGGGRAYAEIERRRVLGAYVVRATVTKAISGGAAQASDLELFSYDVLIRATEAHGR